MIVQDYNHTLLSTRQLKHGMCVNYASKKFLKYLQLKNHVSHPYKILRDALHYVDSWQDGATTWIGEKSVL